MIIGTQLEKADSSLGWNYYLPIDAEQAMQFIDGENRRVICNAGSEVVFHCALMPDGKGIHWSDNVKNPEIRIRRALVMVRHLINQLGEVDFKLLNQEMKEENQKAKKR